MEANRYPQMTQRAYRDRFNPAFDDFPIGMSYVPWQTWKNLYPPEKGLCEGTIFMDLNQIFCGKRGNRA